MKALANLKNLNSDDGRKMIVRNLSRILDIRIIDIDVNNGTLFFLYSNPLALKHVERELRRIDFPVQKYNSPIQESEIPAMGENSKLQGRSENISTTEASKAPRGVLLS